MFLRLCTRKQKLLVCLTFTFGTAVGSNFVMPGSPYAHCPLRKYADHSVYFAAISIRVLQWTRRRLAQTNHAYNRKRNLVSTQYTKYKFADTETNIICKRSGKYSHSCVLQIFAILADSEPLISTSFPPHSYADYTLRNSLCADSYNNAFTSVFINGSQNILPLFVALDYPEMPEIIVTTPGIVSIIDDVKVSSSARLNDINSKVPKSTKHASSLFLSTLFSVLVDWHLTT